MQVVRAGDQQTSRLGGGRMGRQDSACAEVWLMPVEMLEEMLLRKASACRRESWTRFQMTL